jgi:hypothetical protein
MAGEAILAKFFSEQGCGKILYFIVVSLFAVACHNPKQPVILYAQEEDIRIEVDSVLSPEMAQFPIRIRLTNLTNKKVVLIFDTISNDYEHQVKNLFLTNGKDTFNLGIRVSGLPLILNERTVTSFNCFGYFNYGEGHFNSFKEIESGFKEGKLVYKLGKGIITKDHLKELNIEADTLILPTKLEARTYKALLVDEFFPQSFEPIREVKIKKEEIRHTTTPKKHKNAF